MKYLLQIYGNAVYATQLTKKKRKKEKKNLNLCEKFQTNLIRENKPVILLGRSSL